MSRIKFTRFGFDRSAFTLIETIGVIGCILILLGITLPAVMAVRESSRKAQCASNLHQIGIAVSNCHQRLGRLPSGRHGHYLEMAPDLELPTFISRDFGELVQCTSPTLKCPSDHGPICSVRYRSSAIPEDETLHDVSANYFMNMGSNISPLNGALKDTFGNAVSYKDFLDGQSNTVLMGEHPRVDGMCTNCPPTTRWWATDRIFHTGEESTLRKYLSEKWKAGSIDSLPHFNFHETTIGSHFYVDHLWMPNTPLISGVCEGNPYAVVSPASFHSGGVYELFADGSVRFISEQIDENVWVAIGSRNGHEVVNSILD